MLKNYKRIPYDPTRDEINASIEIFKIKVRQANTLIPKKILTHILWLHEITVFEQWLSVLSNSLVTNTIVKQRYRVRWIILWYKTFISFLGFQYLEQHDGDDVASHHTCHYMIYISTKLASKFGLSIDCYLVYCKCDISFILNFEYG